MALRPKLRFEVFKRDGFTCQYCGRRTPDATLECDHIVPKSGGGKDSMDNLLTSCWECNRGKGARPVGDAAPRPDMAGRAEDLKERQKQVKAYYAQEEAIASALEEQVDRVLSYWEGELDNRTGARWAQRRSVRTFVRKLGPNRVMEAMDIADGKANGDFRYLCAVCWSWVKKGGGDAT